ncbi:hypothetical protein OIV19_11950 [Brucella sp. HL-2]|nr:hypothetical protein [Brucella sp. HL-2]MCV9908325.1 hypothetical protein [Brucella sp. HL-2]
MAYQDRFYTIGDVTVQNGSAVVTGTGTGWETALIDGGVIFVGGGSYPIYSVESETSLTLAYTYSGVSGADLPYAVDRQRASATSNIQMNDRLAQIIREIGIGNIEEFNALTLQPHKALSTDSQGKLQLINLGILGRSLIALGVGTTSQYLQGDGTLQDKAGLPVSTATQNALNTKIAASQVLPAVAAGTAGAVGTYGLMIWLGATIESPGQITSGVNLAFTNGLGAQFASPTGSWRLMSGATGNSTAPAKVSLWLRYA